MACPAFLSVLAFLAFRSIALASPAPLEALLAPDGSLAIRDGATGVGSIEPGWSAKGWTGLEIVKTGRPSGGKAGRVLELKGGGTLTCAATATQRGDGVLITYVVAVTATRDMESVHASLFLPVGDWIGSPYAVGPMTGAIPAVTGDVRLASGEVDRLTLGPSATPARVTLTLTPPQPRPLLLQDSRKWGGGLEIRVHDLHPGGAPWTWTPALTQRIAFVLTADRPIRLAVDAPVTLKAGKEWIPLRPAPEVLAGSALDWSAQGLTRTRAGGLGWLRASREKPGSFEFEREPGRPVRFYATNIGTGALFPTADEAERLADRLARRGYTSVRFHHYEMAPWTRDNGFLDPKAPNTLTLHAGRMDRFDRFVAALERRGIYLTTDLYVSRPVLAAEVYPGATGDLDYGFKHLIHVNAEARENWKAFARVLLAHVNPYTGLAYKDDPGLSTLVLVNEGNMGNDLSDLRKDPREAALWDAAFAAWKTRSGLSGDWGSPVCGRFVWETHRQTERELTRFLREELGVKAMITDLNGWTDEWGAMACRTGLDFVDNHMYWDHPAFLEGAWNLPSRGSSGGGSAVKAGGAGTGLALTRLLDRPFTVSEFHFVPPNPFRAESGLLYGAFAALQDWGALYRFAYSGDPRQTFAPGPVSFFDIVNDPIAVASEYAAVALFQRGDVAPAPHAVAVSEAENVFWKHADERVGSPVEQLAWVTRLGTLVGAQGDKPAGVLGVDLGSGGDQAATALGMLRSAGWIRPDNATDLAAGVVQSETGEVTLAKADGTLIVSTPRTAGLVLPAGLTRTAGPLTVATAGAFAAVWASSLDGKPLDASGRILLVHLTDVKNTGDRFRGRDMKVLEGWGTLPYLVRAGTAAITLRRSATGRVMVWRLDGSGRRVAKVPVRRSGADLAFTANTATRPDATFYYELVGD